MKKIFLLGFLLMAFSALQAQTCQVQENSFQNVRVHFTAGSLSITDVNTPAGDFSRVSMDDTYLTTAVGQPQLPVMVRLMEIPLCDGVEYEITASHYQDYSAEALGVHHPLFPAQPANFKSGHDTPEFAYDAATYSRDQWHGDLITVEKSGVARNINLATVYFSPVQYNPVTNQYRVYDDIEVNFTFQNADIPATYEMKSLHGNAVFNGLRSHIINPVEETREHTFSAPIKYLIVANSMFRGQLDEFVAWKQRQGFSVEIAYTDDPGVGTTTTAIANFIKAKYTNATETEPAPTYVLLVGDIAQIPVFNAQVSGENHKTDLYYFTWTDGDYFPDCFYGRFSAQNATHLSNILAKVMQYEQYTMPDPTYLNDAVLVAGSDASWSPTHANGQINYLANNYINTEYGFSNVHTYLYNSSSQAAQIRADIGAGVGYANYTAHCGSDGWSDPEFNTSQISAMSNVDKYPFMIGNCCLSNKFDENECFGEALLRTANKGAAGYIGGSNSTIWDEDFYWSVGVRSTINANATYDAAHLGAYDRMFHTHGEDFSDWYVSAGSIIYGGNLAVESASSSYKLYYWEIYHLMGDPSMLPWLSQPEPMTVSAPAAMVSGATDMTVTAVPYAYVALTENGSVIAAATASATGVATLTFNPVLASNTYELAVTAQNYQPFFQTITAIVPDGPYVVTTDIALSNGQEPNYGGYVTLDATLRNLGVDGASNITSTIALDNPTSEVSIVESTITLSALAANDHQSFAGAFGINIANDVADRTNVPFTITTTCGDQTTTTHYVMTLQAPVLSNTVVSSAEAEGNDNGSINPGETVTLRITTRNAGHANAVGTYSHLSCAYDQVTIANDDIALGDIQAQGSSVSEFTIQLSGNVPEPFIIPFIHNLYAGAYSYTDTVYVFVGECVEDFETGDFSKFNWSNSSNAWTVGNGAYEGSYCAVSKSGMSYGNSCTLTLSIHAAANDSISYYRRFNAGSGWYGNDEFAFLIDNVQQESITTTTPWGRAAFPISAGTHTIKFKFSREAYGGSSSTARVDYIKFPMDGEMAPLAIAEAESHILSVYPNPAIESVNITLPEGNANYQLTLFDLNGKQLMSRTINAGCDLYTLDVSHLTSGIYLISIFNDNDAFTAKVVKQ